MALILMVCTLPIPGAEAASQTMKVKGGWLRLRANASYNSDTISSYFTGTTVTVLGQKGIWYCVRTPDGRVGYMNGNYLTSTGTGAGAGSAEQNITAYVTSKNGKGVRLRHGPGASYGVIRQIPVGTKATILSAGTYWHYISVDGNKGYMMAEYLTTKKPDTAPSNPSEGETDYNAYVTSGNDKSVRLRKGPGKNYGSLGSYAVGTVVTVHGISGSWSRVSVAGVSGYMMSQYLTTKKPDTTPSVPSQPGSSSYTAYVTSENGKSVNLREAMSTGSTALGKYAVGTTATVLSNLGTWCHVEINGLKGYMMSKFLTTRQPAANPGSTASYTAYVISENGKGVYLRSGAGKNYSSVGFYGVGTKVTVLEHNTTWDYVRIGSREGYMMNQYLRRSASAPTPEGKEVTGVTLSNAFPTPGETLWANVTPSGANVTYEWMTDNGLLLATSASLTLNDDDVGLRIRVRVTGTNDYTGTAVSAYATVSKAGASTGTVLKSVTIDNNAPTVGQTLTAGVQPAGATATYKWLRGDGTQVGTAKAYTVQPGDVGYALWCEATGTGSYTGTATSSKTEPVKAAQADKPLSGTVSLNFSAILPGVTLKPNVAVNCQNITYHWYAGGVEVSNAAQLVVTSDMAGKEVKLVVKAADGSGFTGQLESNVCTVLSGAITTTTDL